MAPMLQRPPCMASRTHLRLRPRQAAAACWRWWRWCWWSAATRGWPAQSIRQPGAPFPSSCQVARQQLAAAQHAAAGRRRRRHGGLERCLLRWGAAAWPRRLHLWRAPRSPAALALRCVPVSWPLGLARTAPSASRCLWAARAGWRAARRYRWGSAHRHRSCWRMALRAACTSRQVGWRWMYGSINRNKRWASHCLGAWERKARLPS